MAESKVDYISKNSKGGFEPRVKDTFCIVVLGVIIDAKNVLMIQECRADCYGKWYLPAGRLERHEDLIDGTKREVEEESGLLFEPISLLYAEVSEGLWIRFSFIGQSAGGSLKKTADSESLQADWLDLSLVKAGGSSDYPIRMRDILEILHFAEQFKSHYPVLPTTVPHRKMLIRLVLRHRNRSDNLVTLKSLASGASPVILIEPKRVLSTINEYLQEVYGDSKFNVIESYRLDQLYLLDVEFSGTPPGTTTQNTDGCLLTVLLLPKESRVAPPPDIRAVTKAVWVPLVQLAPQWVKPVTQLGLPKLVLLDLPRQS